MKKAVSSVLLCTFIVSLVGCEKIPEKITDHARNLNECVSRRVLLNECQEQEREFKKAIAIAEQNGIATEVIKASQRIADIEFENRGSSPYEKISKSLSSQFFRVTPEEVNYKIFSDKYSCSDFSGEDLIKTIGYITTRYQAKFYGLKAHQVLAEKGSSLDTSPCFDIDSLDINFPILTTRQVEKFQGRLQQNYNSVVFEYSFLFPPEDLSENINSYTLDVRVVDNGMTHSTMASFDLMKSAGLYGANMVITDDEGESFQFKSGEKLLAGNYVLTVSKRNRLPFTSNITLDSNTVVEAVLQDMIESEECGDQFLLTSENLKRKSRCRYEIVGELRKLNDFNGVRLQLDVLNKDPSKKLIFIDYVLNKPSGVQDKGRLDLSGNTAFYQDMQIEAGILPNGKASGEIRFEKSSWRENFSELQIQRLGFLNNSSNNSQQ